MLLWQFSKKPASDEIVQEPAFPSVSVLAAIVIMPKTPLQLLAQQPSESLKRVG